MGDLDVESAVGTPACGVGLNSIWNVTEVPSLTAFRAKAAVRLSVPGSGFSTP